MGHLEPGHASTVLGPLMKSGKVARNLHDIRPANTPVRHSFELRDEDLIYSRGRRLYLHQNQIVREEIDKMLRAGIVTPASSAWYFPVVIETKKDGKPCSCVDYRRLNQKIKHDRWPIPMEEEIFDDLSGS